MTTQKIKSKFQIYYKTKTNIWGHTKLKLKLKKRKWQNLFIYSKLFPKPRKKRGKFFKTPKFIKKKRRYTLKSLFKYKLQEKQKFKYYYGNLLNRSLKKMSNDTKNKHVYSVKKNYFRNIESKLSVVLVRSNFVENIFVSKFLIKKGKIFINNQIVKNIHYSLKRSDFIKFDLPIKTKMLLIYKLQDAIRSFYRFKLKIVRRRFFPKHLVINFKTLTILYFSEILKVKNIYYPIKFNKKLLSRYYR